MGTLEFSDSDLIHHPVFTMENRSTRSYGSYSMFISEEQKSQMASSSLLALLQEEGVMHQGALLTLPPLKKDDEEQWVTVYGFSLNDRNLVLREFEKCGTILKHVPSPNNANWMNILYESRSDAQKALDKHGMQIYGGAVIIGVSLLDPPHHRPQNQKLIKKFCQTSTSIVNNLANVVDVIFQRARPWFRDVSKVVNVVFQKATSWFSGTTDNLTQIRLVKSPIDHLISAAGLVSMIYIARGIYMGNNISRKLKEIKIEKFAQQKEFETKRLVLLNEAAKGRKEHLEIEKAKALKKSAGNFIDANGDEKRPVQASVKNTRDGTNIY